MMMFANTIQLGNGQVLEQPLLRRTEVIVLIRRPRRILARVRQPQKSAVSPQVVSTRVWNQEDPEQSAMVTEIPPLPLNELQIEGPENRLLRENSHLHTRSLPLLSCHAGGSPSLP